MLKVFISQKLMYLILIFKRMKLEFIIFLKKDWCYSSDKNILIFVWLRFKDNAIFYVFMKK